MNQTLHPWELNTPKDIRVGAIEDVCTTYKGCFTKLSKGQISHFEVGFRKKSSPRKCMLLPKTLLKKTKDGLRLAPQMMKGDAQLKIGKRSWKELQHMVIEHDCRLVLEKNEYFMMIPRKKVVSEPKTMHSYCGIDMGIRTFATVFGRKVVRKWIIMLHLSTNSIKGSMGCVETVFILSR